ncbi:MAG: pimeloyl-ACP methyl ester carboxylesterase [Planctomycetota bacterium]|jgi:pimeloyl-ACP methyl ester carboxylesterase
MRRTILLLSVPILVSLAFLADDDLLRDVEHHYADSDGVKIHYAALGDGPLVVMIHGFPDYWYTWRDQMKVLATEFRVLAIDQRGYNLSDQPEGTRNYDMQLLVADVAAVIRDAEEESAIIVGHDWGGLVAWNFAMHQPEMTNKLVVLNLPHPICLARELAENPEQQANSSYARTFQTKSPSDPDVFFGFPMTPQTLSGWVEDREARKHYVEAFERSSFDGMLAYYKRNFPGAPSLEAFGAEDLPRVQVPVLQFHGLADQALHSDGLNYTWDYLEQDLTLVTIPGAGHFVQQDASELVTKTMLWWMTRD